jgi:tyrosyl-tRNA synthetase
MMNKEKIILTTQLLAEPGKEKMGKTENNFIALDETPNEMFGKIMSWPDEMIQPSFTLLTDISLETMEASQLNPIDKKKWLAREIVANLHSEREAQQAQGEFEKIFQKRNLPEENLSVYSIKPMEKNNILKILTEGGLVKSRGEAKRLITQGGVDVDGSTIKEISEVKMEDGSIIRAGKRKFLKIKIIK